MADEGAPPAAQPISSAAACGDAMVSACTSLKSFTAPIGSAHAAAATTPITAPTAAIAAAPTATAAAGPHGPLGVAAYIKRFREAPPLPRGHRDAWLAPQPDPKAPAAGAEVTTWTGTGSLSHDTAVLAAASSTIAADAAVPACVACGQGDAFMLPRAVGGVRLASGALFGGEGCGGDSYEGRVQLQHQERQQQQQQEKQQHDMTQLLLERCRRLLAEKDSQQRHQQQHHHHQQQQQQQQQQQPSQQQQQVGMAALEKPPPPAAAAAVLGRGMSVAASGSSSTSTFQQYLQALAAGGAGVGLAAGVGVGVGAGVGAGVAALKALGGEPPAGGGTSGRSSDTTYRDLRVLGEAALASTSSAAVAGGAGGAGGGGGGGVLGTGECVGAAGVGLMQHGVAWPSANSSSSSGGDSSSWRHKLVRGEGYMLLVLYAPCHSVPDPVFHPYLAPLHLCLYHPGGLEEGGSQGGGGQGTGCKGRQYIANLLSVRSSMSLLAPCFVVTTADAVAVFCPLLPRLIRNTGGPRKF